MKRERVIEIYSDRDAWRTARKTFVGASDAPAIVGVCPFRSPMEVWASKSGFDVPKEPTEAMEWGHILEPVIAQQVGLRTGRRVQLWDQAAIIRHPERRWIACTPDAFFHGEEELIQIKTTRFATCDLEHDELPLNYQVQIQHELMVTGCEAGTLAVLVGGQQLIVRRVLADREFQAWLLDREQEFWKSVIAKQAPPVDDSVSCRRALTARTVSEAKIIEGEAAYRVMEIDAELIEVKAQLESLNKAKVLLENQILEVMDGCEEIRLPTGTTYSYKQQTRKAYSVQESKYRVLRRGKE